MSDLKDQIASNVVGDMDVFKKIASKIPGFKGYIERQNRRDADKLVRTTLFNRFRELEDSVSALQRDCISAGDIDNVGKIEATAIKLRTFADRVRTARRGYSGLFSAVKVNEDDLTRLYDYDAAMLDLVDQDESRNRQRPDIPWFGWHAGCYPQHGDHRPPGCRNLRPP